MTSRSPSADPTARRAHRLLLQGLAAITVLLPLVLLEGLVRLSLPAPPPAAADPYVSFGGLGPLFVPSDDGTRYETAASRRAYFTPQSFAARKKAATYRVFCLGGSTVQGRPYGPDTAFSAWLALNLRAAWPDRDIEVVNAGGVSYASYRLVPILRELLDHEPDLIVLCTGHNEFLEDRTYAPLKRVPAWLVACHRRLLSLRSYAWLDHLRARLRHRPAARTELAPEVHATLDRPRGLSLYHRDPTWRAGVIAHFAHNIETLLALAGNAGVPLLLVTPPANVRDCPPFKSAPSPGLSAADRERSAAWRAAARSLDWDRARDKLGLLERAAALDPHDAELLYLVGQCHLRLGQDARAAGWLKRALDEDLCPLRILPSMREVLRRSAARHHVPLIDLHQALAARSPGHLVGDAWLVDHVHPTIEGHQLLADLLTQRILADRPGRSDWRQLRQGLWQQHLAALPPLYFAAGAARLESLRMWSRGTRPDSLPAPADPNS